MTAPAVVRGLFSFMPIRRYTIDPPFAHQTGDTYRKAGGQIEQVRGTTVIDTRPAVSSLLTEVEHVGSDQVSAIYEEAGPVTKTITGISVVGTVTYFNFSDGNQREIPGGHASGVGIANDMDIDNALAENLLIAKAYRHSPDGTALDDMVGSTVVVDTNAAVPVQFNLTI